ncbi:hypothetical protein BLNAU_24538 [Blattamonas nauphoetae]|uniref:Protein kinase domain-containing protein n=1 Tax=Blattamonas nauphoetae TaxID=2049346 RepID=A0ABQ9WMI3_9EUKA|nr:hypothetical protein BLNAU_24538 [Blattamonas nauphoetae]
MFALKTNGGSGSQAGDMWAFGLIVLELLTGQEWISGTNAVEIAESVKAFDVQAVCQKAKIPKSVEPLLCLLLSKNPQERLSSVELIRSGRLMKILGEETPLSQFIREELDATKKTVDQLLAQLNESERKNAKFEKEKTDMLEKLKYTHDSEHLRQENERLRRELLNAPHLLNEAPTIAKRFEDVESLNKAFFRVLRKYSTNFIPNYPSYQSYLNTQVHGVATIVPNSFLFDGPFHSTFDAKFSLTDPSLIKYATITCLPGQIDAMQHAVSSFRFTATFTGCDRKHAYLSFTLIEYTPCSNTWAGEEYERFLSECGFSVDNLPRPTIGSTVETACGIVCQSSYDLNQFLLRVDGFDMPLTESDEEFPHLTILAESCRQSPQPREWKVSISNSDGSKMIVRLLGIPTAIRQQLHQTAPVRQNQQTPPVQREEQTTFSNLQQQSDPTKPDRTHFICDLTGKPIVHRAHLANEPDTIYEKAALQQYVSENGMSPRTFAPVSLDDIVDDTRVIEGQRTIDGGKKQLQTHIGRIGAEECIVAFRPDHIRVSGSTVTNISWSHVNCFTKPG